MAEQARVMHAAIQKYGTDKVAKEPGKWGQVEAKGKGVTGKRARKSHTFRKKK